MTYLPDANVLIAATTLEHVHYKRAVAWLSQRPNIATCPITEAALVRYLMRVSSSGPEMARTILRQIRAWPSHTFWPADVSHLDVDLSRLMGPQQVTDAYLVALAIAKGGRVATFDEALVAVHPQAILIPAEPSA